MGHLGADERPRVKRQMSVHEELFLNTFDKWTGFGKLPITFCLHLLLVLLVSCQVIVLMQKDINHASHAGKHFSNLLLGTSKGHLKLWQPVELQAAIEQVVENSLFIDSVTFNDVQLDVNGSSDADALDILLSFRNLSTLAVTVSRASLLGSDAPGLRPQPQWTAKYLRERLPWLYTHEITQLQKISFSFGLLETVHNLQRADSLLQPKLSHFTWKVSICFDGSSVGSFVGSLDYTLATSGHGTMRPIHFLINLSVIILALLALGLMVKKILRSLQVLLAVRFVASRSQESLSTWEMLAIFSWWWLVSLLCHLLQLASTAECMQATRDVSRRFSLMGWSCFLTWLNVCQYFESFPGYYVTFSTTRKGLASVCRYMASVLPIFTAFMFLGTCCFWRADTFQGISSSYCSLFSLLNGDMVHDAFDDLGSVSGLAGHAYLYVFIFVFIYIVLNVNITIIEEAYYAARFQGDKHERQIEFQRQSSYSSLSHPDLASLSPEQGPDPLPAAAPSGLAQPLLPVAGNQQSTPRSPTATSTPSRRPPLRGAPSPRFFEYPRLSALLAEAFPERSYLSRPEGEGIADQAECCQGEEWHDRVVEWWLTTLPQWSQMLHSMPLPRRSEAVKDHVWKELERRVAEHSNAVDSLSAALHRQAVRT